MDSFKKRVWISSGMVLGAFTIFAVLAYLLFRLITGTTARIVEDRQTAAERSYALNNLTALKQQAPQAAADQTKIEALLPTQDGLLSFPEFLENEAKIQRVDLSFKFNGAPVEPSGKEPGRIAFTADLTGELGNIKNFINTLETRTTKFLVNFDSLDINLGGGAYRAILQGNVYFQ